MNDLKQVYGLAIASRALTICLSICTYVICGSYDSSAELVLPAESPWSFLNVFIRWDAIYFIHIARHGYVYEQEAAFFPVLPYLTHILCISVFKPLQSILGEQYTHVLVGALISNVSFVVAAIFLYKLTLALYPSQPHLAKCSAFAFCLSLPSMFMSAFYTESLFAALSFMGMYAAVSQHYLAAALIWAIASATRSNAIVYVGFFVYFLVLRKQSSSWARLFGVIRSVIYSGITMSGFLLVQYTMYQEHCQDHPRPWCHDRLPLAYTFIQKEYWNNGFMAYYEFKQIPNFLLAMPIIGLSVFGIYQYASQDWRSWLTLGLATKDNRSPFYYLWAFLLVYATTCMHVQVILRFFTSLPPLYWYIGHLWAVGLSANHSPRRQRVAKGLLLYMILYSLIGTILFACFLPPA